MKCPVCNNEFKRINSHILKSKDEKHCEFIHNQEEKIIKLFYNLEFTSKSNNIEFGIYLNYSQCNKIWINKFGKEEYLKRINKINGLHVSKSLSGNKFSEEHKKKLSEAHKGQLAWNKGLTCATDDRVKRYTIKRNSTMSKVLKQKYNKGEMKAWLSGKTKENNPELISMYEKVSNTMSKKEQFNSRGIAVIRNDIGHFAASTYESNIYRIFQYENKKYKKEYDCIFPLKKEDGSIFNYRIDIQDLEGLFGTKNAFIEIKGFMDEKSRLKIKLFKEQYPEYKLLVIGNGDNRENYFWKPDINYNDLMIKYKKLIPLWEDNECNAKKYPDLYDDKKWIIGKRENKRVHQKLLILDNGFKFKIGYLWKHQPFDQRPTYGEHKKFVKIFKAFDKNNNLIFENENWGAILAQVQQHIKDNAKKYYNDYTNEIIIKGYCKSEDKIFDIVKFNVLKNEWFFNK